MALTAERAMVRLQSTEGEDMSGSEQRAGGRGAYRAGVGVAVLTVWTTIVRDDGSGAGFFLVILAIGVGGFAALFRAAGMARTMVGVAIMQACLGLAVATAPSTAQLPGGWFKVVLFNGVFIALWLASAGFFHAAAGREGSLTVA
jgi:hypothetical protein